MHVPSYIYQSPHTRTHARRHAHMHARTQACTHAHTHMCVCVCMHVCVHACVCLSDVQFALNVCPSDQVIYCNQPPSTVCFFDDL